MQITEAARRAELHEGVSKHATGKSWEYASPYGREGVACCAPTGPRNPTIRLLKAVLRAKPHVVEGPMGGRPVVEEGRVDSEATSAGVDGAMRHVPRFAPWAKIPHPTRR
ncbi:MAG: hypothetical protein ACTTKF_06940 [Bacteroides sp.]